MTILYARPNLVDLGDSTGYSLTSGGPSANRTPSFAADTVVFDQNSGPRRTLTGALSVVQVLMSVSMDFVNVLHLTKDSYVWGTVPGIILESYNDNSFSNVYEVGVFGTVGDQGISFGGTDGYWRIQGNFTTTGRINVSAGSGSTQYLYFTDGASITCGSITVTGTYGTIFTGNGISLTVTGAPTTSGGSVCGILNANSPGRCSVTFTDKGPMLKGAILPDSWDVTNDTGNGQGTGGLQINTATIFGIFNCGKGAVTVFAAGAAFTATTWIMDGGGQYNTIKSSSTSTAATLAKSGGGTIAANFCNFNYINCSTTPATAIRATNSKLTGGGTGITLVGMTSRFMPFF